MVFALFLCSTIYSLNIFTAEFGADKISYKGIFDESIYDLKDSDSDAVLLENLDIKKKEKIAAYFTRVIEQSKAYVDSVEKNSEGSPKVIKFIKTVALGLVGFYARSTAGMAVAQTFEQSKAGCQEAIGQENMKKLLSQIEDAKQATTKLMNNIHDEIIGPLEKEYVLKRKYVSIGLRREIETMLIRVRNEESDLSEKLDFIRNALDLPLAPKILNYEEYEKKFLNNKRFNSFDENLRKKLLALIKKICIDSETSDGTSTKLRTTSYFHGHPGTGKTSTTVELAQMLGLPCFSITVHDVSELNRDLIQGTRGWQPRVGWFVEALMAKAPDGKRYTNGILVLNDFDRILIGPGGMPNVAALTFLCEYLDTDLKEIMSGYFKAVIGVRRLNIFVTANTPLPKDVKAYEALLSRADTLAFGGFNEEHVNNFINGFVDDCVNKYKLNASEKVSLTSYAERRYSSLRSKGVLDLRTIKREVENKVFNLDVCDVPVLKPEIVVAKEYSNHSLVKFLWYEPEGLYLTLCVLSAYPLYCVLYWMF